MIFKQYVLLGAGYRLQTYIHLVILNETRKCSYWLARPGTPTESRNHKTDIAMHASFWGWILSPR